MMALPDRLVSDQLLSKAIKAGVVLVLGACILSQIMLQLGGDPRDEPIDVTDQLPESVANDTGLLDARAPFISSGGLFYPEKAVFDIGLVLGGLLFLGLGVEMFVRTQDGLGPIKRSPWRSLFNLAQLGTALVVGTSLVMLTRNPFNISFLAHIMYAMLIFQVGVAWTAALTLSRWSLDCGLLWRGLSINRIRLALVTSGFLSFQLMIYLITSGQLYTSAVFEWTLTFSMEATALTLLPLLVAASKGESE